MHWRAVVERDSRCAQNDGYRAAPFFVILSEPRAEPLGEASAKRRISPSGGLLPASKKITNSLLCIFDRALRALYARRRLLTLNAPRGLVCSLRWRARSAFGSASVHPPPCQNASPRGSARGMGEEQVCEVRSK